MAVVFKGQVEVMINRHRFLGDGIDFTFPEFSIYSNMGGKFSLQFTKNGKVDFCKDDCESVSDAYIAAQVHLGKLELKDGMYVPVNA